MAEQVFLQQVIADATLQGLLDNVEELFSFDGQIMNNEFCEMQDIEYDGDDISFIKEQITYAYQQCKENDEMKKVEYAFNTFMEWYRDTAVYDELFEYTITFNNSGLLMAMATVYQYTDI